MMKGTDKIYKILISTIETMSVWSESYWAIKKHRMTNTASVAEQHPDQYDFLKESKAKTKFYISRIYIASLRKGERV